MSNSKTNTSQIQLLKTQLNQRQSFSEQMYHYEKAQRIETERKAKIATENQVKEQSSRAQIVRDRIKKFTEKNQRKEWLRAEKPIAKKKEKIRKSTIKVKQAIKAEGLAIR